jgi:hypothetical protein
VKGKARCWGWGEVEEERERRRDMREYCREEREMAQGIGSEGHLIETVSRGIDGMDGEQHLERVF